MKLNNLTSLDPAEVARGVKGLAGASRLDHSVWREFHEDWEALAIESEQLRMRLMLNGKLPLADRAADFSHGGLTETEAMATVRLTQGFFRRTVLSAYQAQCCVTSNPLTELLVASHILPWASHPEHRANPRNGLCLSRLYDGAFDRGLITFDDNYRLVLGRRIRDHLTSQTIHDSFAPYEGKALTLPEKFRPDQRFLDEHRKNLFRGA